MFKKAIFAAALVMASSPALVSAQDIIFWSFDEFSRVATTSVAPGTTSATAYLFADENLDFNQLDLNFFNSSPAVVSFAGGRAFNPPAFSGGATVPEIPTAFTSFELIQLTATGGRIFATSFLSRGQVPGSATSNFRAGANGFLLAEIDFDIIGEGTANFDFVLGSLGVVNDGTGEVPVTFQGGTLTVEAVPEPSSAVLMILGAAAMVARRRRS